MSRTSVDVIVPCYNYGRYLEVCLASLLGHEELDIRVLVLDDCSTDTTSDVGVRLAAQDSRVTFRRHSRNLGHILTYNEGLEWVRADYVLLISADDLLTPGALTRATAALDQNPSAVLAHGRQIHFSGEAPPPERSTPACANYSVQSGEAFIAELCRLGHNPVATPTVIVRRATHQRVGSYNPALPHTADLELWLRLATQGPVLSLESDQAYKRRHDRNMQIDYNAPPEGDVLERRNAFESFFAGIDSSSPRVATLRHDALKALGMDLFWRAANAFDERRPDVCDRLLMASAQLCPDIAQSQAWSRMQIKRRLGSGVWSAIRGIAGLRERRSA